jgi:hypothetical protein
VSDECILPNFTLLRYLKASEYLAFTRSCWVQSSLCLATEPPAPLKITRLALRNGNFSLGIRCCRCTVAALSTCALLSALMVASLATPQANREQRKTPIQIAVDPSCQCAWPQHHFLWFPLDADVAPATDVDLTTLHAALQVCQNDWRCQIQIAGRHRHPAVQGPQALPYSALISIHIASTPQRQRRARMPLPPRHSASDAFFGQPTASGKAEVEAFPSGKSSGSRDETMAGTRTGAQTKRGKASPPPHEPTLNSNRFTPCT